MTNVSTPFANTNPGRRPTTEEKELGFPCGPADQTLFNGLFNMIYREMKVLADEAGVSGSDNDFNLLRDSIQALISAATGDGETSGFILLSQAQARLPIHFQFLSADGKINVTSPASGTVRVPGGIGFIHRGIFQGTTTETDFATLANKTYHIRWQLVGGLQIKDLSDVAYNPTALNESDSAFDGTYDDALISRVVTNASNVAAITNLINLPRLATSQYVDGQNPYNAGENGSAFDFSFPFNWARTPSLITIEVFKRGYEHGTGNDHDRAVRTYGSPAGASLTSYPVTRYSSRFGMMLDFSTSLSLAGSFGA